MSRIRRNSQSRKDYLDIWLYVAEDDIEAADALIDQFDEKLNLILKFPDMGKGREDLGKGVRYFPVKKYLLFYRSVPEGIHLLRVLHGATDYPDRI